MHAARRAGKKSFSYKGSVYTRHKSKTGLVVYKKGAVGGSSASGGSFRTAGKLKGGSSTAAGRKVNRTGRRATTLARQATNTAINYGGAMTAAGRKVNKTGRRATTLARQATNMAVTHGPRAMEMGEDIMNAMGGRVRRKKRKRTYK